MQAPLLEGVYRTRLKQQPPASGRTGQRRAHREDARSVIASWARARCCCARSARPRPRIKDYLVEKGQLPDDRIYLIDVSFAEGEDKVMSTPQLHLDSE